MEPKDIIDFWFSEHAEDRWFRSTPDFDKEIGARFATLWCAGRQGELSDWEQTAEGALALVILLDQFPRNMFRGKPESFASGTEALNIAAEAIGKGLDQKLPDSQKIFMYLPYMHSESVIDQERSVALFQQAGLADNLKWANHHRDIIRRFGRFPHRNAALGRESTPEEEAWLASPDGFTP